MIFALWDGDHHALLAPAAQAELWALDVRRLQLNLDDRDVSGALLRLHTSTPIDALVSIWAGPDFYLPTALDWLQQRSGRVAGWLVDERRRLEPPGGVSGQRADALANIALIRRPMELDRKEWLRRWIEEHTAVAIRTQASFGYVQNVVQAALTADAPDVAGLVEELFPAAGMTDPHAFYGSGGDQAELDRRLGELMASVSRIGADRDLDLVPSSQYTFLPTSATLAGECGGVG